MTDRKCSIIETVYNMPELKSCPIETTFRVIGKRWTILIIREIFRGNTQFNRFMENIEGITPKVLTERLRELERLGIVRRRIISEYPVRVEYSLTDMGRGFEPILLSARFLFNEVYAKDCLQRRNVKDTSRDKPDLIYETKNE